MLLEAFTLLKEQLGRTLHLAPDALHIHLGLLGFFAVVALARGERRFQAALWVVLAISVAAEVLDLLYDLRIGRGLRWFNSAKDIANTMFWPGVLTLTARRLVRVLPSSLFRPHRAPHSSAPGLESAGEPSRPVHGAMSKVAGSRRQAVRP